MIPVLSKPVSISIRLLMLLITPYLPLASAEYWEYEEKPSLQNNFAEARFRLWVPPTKGPVKGVLFLALGTDSNGLHLSADSQWQKLATEIHFALVSAHLRGEGEAYEIAEKGSGQALLNALNNFGLQTGRPELAGLPLILWGHSAGGQFAYHFASWKPERTLGFITIKWASYTGPPSPLTYQVPALIIAGEHDEPGRNQSLARVYEHGRKESAPWAFLLEKDAGHGLDQTRLLVLPFIQALARDNKTRPFHAEIERGRIEAGHSKESGDPRISWLPNRETALQWQKLHQPFDLNALLTSPPHSLPTPGLTLSPTILDWGKVPQDSQPVSRSLTVVLAEPGNNTSLKLKPGDSRLRHDITTTPEGFRINVTFDPKGLPIGPYRSQALIQTGSKDSKQESAEISVYGIITSNVAAQPTSLYLGVLPRKSQASFRLKINSASGEIKLVKAVSSEPDWIQPQILESTPGLLEFDCQVTTGERIGRRYGELRFTVQTDQRKEIVVPYIGFVKK